MRLKMGEAGRMRAEKLFSIEENVRKTERLYRELLGR
jgi:glycosyltransferase involved in cell wall biosynthesis